MPTIFISYSHEDLSFAEALEARLVKQGHTVWRDKTRLVNGASLPSEISSGIDVADVFCLLVSKRSMKSKWVQAEWEAAFSRWTQREPLLLIPILLEDAHLPSLLLPFLAIDARINASIDYVAQHLGQQIFQRALSGSMKTIDWLTFVSTLADDQFILPGHQFGAWSKSYSLNYLPLVYPHDVPETTSPSDSITVTQEMIRGLTSLKRLLGDNSKSQPTTTVISTMLARARSYLLSHFQANTGAAGVCRQTSRGIRIRPDSRHSATFAKGYFLLNSLDLQPVKKAIAFSLKNLYVSDRSIGTYAEIASIVWMVLQRRELRPNSITPKDLDRIRRQCEDALGHKGKIMKRGNRKGWLFGVPEEWNFAIHDTKWVLDGAGDLLFKLGSPAIRLKLRRALETLKGLRITDDSGRTGYPMELGGTIDIGTTAMIAETLLRFDPAGYHQQACEDASTVANALTPQFLRNYPFICLLWAVPCLAERITTLRQDTANHTSL